MRPPNGGISRILAAVDHHHEFVVAVPEASGEPRLERGVAVAMRGDRLAIEADPRIGHGAVEDDADLPPGPGRIGPQRLAIGELPLVAPFVEIRERQLHRSVRQGDRDAVLEEPAVVEARNRTHEEEVPI
jgi:hypothetical protein